MIVLRYWKIIITIDLAVNVTFHVWWLVGFSRPFNSVAVGCGVRPTSCRWQYITKCSTRRIRCQAQDLRNRTCACGPISPWIIAGDFVAMIATGFTAYSSRGVSTRLLRRPWYSSEVPNRRRLESHVSVNVHVYQIALS